MKNDSLVFLKESARKSPNCLLFCVCFIISSDLRFLVYKIFYNLEHVLLKKHYFVLEPFKLSFCNDLINNPFLLLQGKEQNIAEMEPV